MKATETALCSLIRLELENAGCELVDLDVVNVRGTTVVRVYADRKGGITLDMIEEAAGRIRDGFDRVNILGADYRLEVSSPGEKRSLRKGANLSGFLGRSVMVYLREGGTASGSMVEAKPELLTLLTGEGTSVRIGIDTIEDMHLLYTCNQ